jgi:hypothetical protein
MGYLTKYFEMCNYECIMLLMHDILSIQTFMKSVFKINISIFVMTILNHQNCKKNHYQRIGFHSSLSPNAFHT